jgi:uncharacterized Fe-S center protein
MAANVYFASLRARSVRHNKISSVKRLFDAAGFAGFLRGEGLVAIKTHVGERGNDTYINPVFVRQVVDRVKRAGAKPFVTDTNTLYRGGRSNAPDHTLTALEHGYTFATVGAPFIVADGLTGENAADVDVGLKHFSRVKIARDIVCADALIVLSHFKGHELAGFGGAVKNLAMGCASRMGKQDQHRVSMLVNADNCTGCGTCGENCPVGAARVLDGKSVIDRETCIGCGECLAMCPEKCIEIDWITDVSEFMERMCEYAAGAVRTKKGKTGFINFVINVTPDCDCIPWSDTPIVPDVGILASIDPVALDQACLDLVNRQAGVEGSLLSRGRESGADKFTGLWSHTRCELQLSYSETIGLGSRKYNLARLDEA